MLKKDLCRLYGLFIGGELYQCYLENEKFNPQALWGFVSEHIHRAEPVIKALYDERNSIYDERNSIYDEGNSIGDEGNSIGEKERPIKLCDLPSSTWEQISNTGQYLCRNSNVTFYYDASLNEPPELKNLYDAFRVAEDAVMLQQKFKKQRVRKIKHHRAAFTCKYCWREIEQGEWCELHVAGTSERKKADRRIKHYLKQLTQVKNEFNQNRHSQDLFSHLKNWANKKNLDFEDKPSLLAKLDGRKGVNYSVDYLLKKQCAILNNMDPSRIGGGGENLLLTVLLRAEAFLRADAIVVSKKG